MPPITRRELVLGALFSRHRDMVRLPGATFRMGADESALLKQFPNAGAGLRSMLLSETPATEVTLRPFWIDRYEVTNAQFQRFTRAKPEWGKGRIVGNYLQHWNGNQFPLGQANFPVTFVTWGAALAYAKWRGKRLPTEAEWELAARGGRDTIYPWGDQPPNPSLANFAQSNLHAPAVVGSYPANPFGIFDLAGNVWEFCMDDWHDRHSVEPHKQSDSDIRRMRDAQSERRVIRGGSFDGGAFNMRVTARDSHPVDNPVGFVGFRCARSA